MPKEVMYLPSLEKFGCHGDVALRDMVVVMSSSQNDSMILKVDQTVTTTRVKQMVPLLFKLIFSESSWVFFG